MLWTHVISGLTPLKAMWIVPIRIRDRYLTARFRVGMSAKGRNFLFFPLLPFPPPTKKFPSPQLSLHKYWVLRLIYEMFMMWVGCWFWSNHKIRKPKFIRKPWTKHPRYVQVHWGLYTVLYMCQLLGVCKPILLLNVQTNPGSRRTNRPLCLQRNYPCVFGVLPQIRHDQPDLIQVTRFCPWALAKAGREGASCFGTVSLAKYSRPRSSITLTLALLYNRHKRDRRDEKEAKTITSTADNHLLIGITNQLLLFNILILF